MSPFCSATVLATALLVASPIGIDAFTPAGAPTRALAGRYVGAPSLAVDSTGAVHLSVVDVGGDLWYATDRGGRWMSRKVLDAADPVFARWEGPSLALDAQDRVHIAVTLFMDSTPSSTGGIFEITDRGHERGVFGPRVRIAPHRARDAALKLRGDVRYLAYDLIEWPEQDEPVYLRSGRPGDWQTHRLASYGRRPSLRLADDGTAHVTFSQDTRLRHAVIPPGGRVSMSTVDTVDQPFTSALALDRAGRPQVAWVSGDAVARWSRRGASGWPATPERIGPASSVALSVGPTGAPIVVTGGDRVRLWRRTPDGWRPSLVARAEASGVAVRAAASGPIIAWNQVVLPRGIWVTRR